MSKDASETTQVLSGKLRAAQEELSKVSQDSDDKAIRLDSLHKRIEELEGRLLEVPETPNPKP
jgi:chromosome segregation ATPase